MPDGMAEERIQASGLKDRPVPLETPSVLGWKEVPIKENGEPLVALGPFSDNDEIFTDSIYFGERSNSPYTTTTPEGSLITMFVRRDVAEQLKKAQRILPQGMYLVVFDSFRTIEVQQALFDKYFRELQDQNPDWSNDQLLTETQKYVSLPSTDPIKPSPHNTGGSVDLAIFQLPKEIDDRVKQINQKIAEHGGNWQEIYKLEMQKIALIRNNAQLLNFGTPFDWGGEEAAISFFEKQATLRDLRPEEEEARDNRRILFNVMSSAGFEPYADEWWHYNVRKSQMGAKTVGLQQAEYGAVALSQDNLKHEKMRKDHRIGSIRILEGARFVGKVNVLDEAFKVAQQAVSETGDPRFTSLPQAAVIAPPKKG